jgi:hypothetical protein
VRAVRGEIQALRALGEAINYNAYGDAECDLLVPPARLAGLLRPTRIPWCSRAASRGGPAGRQPGADLELAWRIAPERDAAGCGDLPAAGRPVGAPVQGVFANALSQREPDAPTPILRAVGDAGFLVSVRAPRSRPHGADALCRGFGTGGGRASAAGIDCLPRDRLDEFSAALDRSFPA